jgi:putative proteasome-type protease
MTFCAGIRVRDGIVAIADTQIVRGSEQASKQKLTAVIHADDSLFVMTSGLRSIRDKTLIYLDETLRKNPPYDRLYKVVNLFGESLRRVREEDGDSLAASGMLFNTHAIIGGCLADDDSPQMFYVYPEGNWIEASTDTPYFLIGRTSYGKPILDRLLTYDSSLEAAVSLALLAFDATRTSVTDVDCPIDIAVAPNHSRQAKIIRFTQQDIEATTQWWSQTLRDAIPQMPMTWAEKLFQA